MKNQSYKGLLFSSEDIKIFMEEDLCPEKISPSIMNGNKLSFNVLFFLSPNINLKAQNCENKFLFKKNQYILHYSSQENIAELWTETQETLKYLQIQINYNYIVNLINPETNKESADILERMVRNDYVFLHEQTPPSMTVEMQMIVNEIISYSKKGIIQKLFVEAKIIKLLILIFEQFNEKNTAQETPKTPLLIKNFVDENYQNKYQSRRNRKTNRY